MDKTLVSLGAVQIVANLLSCMGGGWIGFVLFVHVWVYRHCATSSNASFAVVLLML